MRAPNWKDRSATGQLTRIMHERITTVDVAGESEFLTAPLIWLVIDPRPQDVIDDTLDLIAEFTGRTPATVADWDHLARVGLALAATVSEVEACTSRHGQALLTRGMKTPDGGNRNLSR